MKVHIYPEGRVIQKPAGIDPETLVQLRRFKWGASVNCTVNLGKY